MSNVNVEKQHKYQNNTLSLTRMFQRKSCIASGRFVVKAQQTYRRMDRR